MARGAGDTVAPRAVWAAPRHPRRARGAGGLGTPGSPRAALQKPWQVCATLKLCRGESGAAPAAPILEAPGTHLQVRGDTGTRGQPRSVPSSGCSVPLPQGSGGAGLSPEALPLPLPLCWLCRSLVARAEAAVPVGAVAAAVAGLCRALPLPVAGACQCLAERYAALAIEGLLGRLGPRLLCRLFFACRSGDNGDIEDVGTLPPVWVFPGDLWVTLGRMEVSPDGPWMSLQVSGCPRGSLGCSQRGLRVPLRGWGYH
uniref:Saposin B-type domain-containing protein n=1 Tax=Catharus ustulatus TaxID=91951 RepID=A0A8C3V7Z4_CATUS